MKKFGDIITEIASKINYTHDEISVEDSDDKNRSETVKKWETEEVQNKLKIAMENEQPDRGAPGIKYPNYISWVEHTELKLLYVRNRRAEFRMKYRFSAEIVIREFGYVFLKILKEISPEIRSLKINSPDDAMFRCERAVIYEEYI